MNLSVEARFWARVHKVEGSCWWWTGAIKNGYGAFVPHTGFHQVGAHRFAYELLVARIPPGMNVLHRCDNPACVNPDHLFLGTQQDNMADKVRKGRQARGEVVRSVELSYEKVQEIRRLSDDEKLSHREIGLRVDVSEYVARRVIKRRDL